MKRWIKGWALVVLVAASGALSACDVARKLDPLAPGLQLFAKTQPPI